MSFDSQKRTNKETNIMHKSIHEVTWYAHTFNMYMLDKDVVGNISTDALFEWPEAFKIVVPKNLMEELQGYELIKGRLLQKMPIAPDDRFVVEPTLWMVNTVIYPYDPTPLIQEREQKRRDNVNKVLRDAMTKGQSVLIESDSITRDFPNGFPSSFGI